MCPAADIDRLTIRSAAPGFKLRAGIAAGSRARVAAVGTRALLLDGLAAGVDRTEGLRFAGRWPTVDALRRSLGAFPPQVVVADAATVPRPALAGLRDAMPAARVVVLAEVPDGHVPLVLDGRVDGVLLLSAGATEAGGALRQVLAGHVVLPGGLGPLVPPAPRDPLAALSARQVEIVRLAARGLTNAEIARQLFVSVNTVKFHLRSAYAQLGVHNRTQAALRLTHPNG